MAYKDSLNCLQIMLGGKVHHREKFVVELAMLLSRIIITPDKMIEHLDMRVDVTSRVHRHETRELQESWINRSSHPSVGKGTVLMQCRRNHSVPRLSASTLTTVGLLRGSIGPLI